MKTTAGEILFFSGGTVIALVGCFSLFVIGKNFSFPVNSLIQTASFILGGIVLMATSIVSTWWNQDKRKLESKQESSKRGESKSLDQTDEELKPETEY